MSKTKVSHSWMPAVLVAMVMATAILGGFLVTNALMCQGPKVCLFSE